MLSLKSPLRLTSAESGTVDKKLLISSNKFSWFPKFSVLSLELFWAVCDSTSGCLVSLAGVGSCLAGMVFFCCSLSIALCFNFLSNNEMSFNWINMSSRFLSKVFMALFKFSAALLLLLGSTRLAVLSVYRSSNKSPILYRISCKFG